jgi:hypothetical protein
MKRVKTRGSTEEGCSDAADDRSRYLRVPNPRADGPDGLKQRTRKTRGGHRAAGRLDCRRQLSAQTCPAGVDRADWSSDDRRPKESGLLSSGWVAYLLAHLQTPLQAHRRVHWQAFPHLQG